jgi:hypothetical protein
MAIFQGLLHAETLPGRHASRNLAHQSLAILFSALSRKQFYNDVKIATLADIL